MVDGFIPTPDFNEQLKKTVRENERRLRSEINRRARWHKKGSGGGDYFWFTVNSLVCPGEDPTNFPDGGLIVTATYSPTGTFPRGRNDDGTYYVYDYMGILDFSIDAVDNINGSKGRCSWGAEIGTTDFMWILDSIIVQPSCA
jgi:hypothetical protein